MTEAAPPIPAQRLAGLARLLSDEALAERAATGDRRAFEEIYERYGQDLHRYCVAVTGSSQDAQDALQNTMVKALQALPGEKRSIRLKPWLYRIARNESVETIRKRRDTADLGERDVPSGAQLTETVEARDRLRALIGDLGELPERQRAALVMRELAGLGFEEIGETFGSSAAVARQTVYEARVSLGQMEAGREMSCNSLRRDLSDADGRVLRRREVRAHLRDCPDCRAFRDGISTRSRDLAAIAPLPVLASATLLQGALAGKAGSALGAGSGAGAAGTGGLTGSLGGGELAGSAIVKAVATVAVVATVGVSVGDREGLIHLPFAAGGPTHRSGDAGAPVSAPAGAGTKAELGSSPGGGARRGDPGTTPGEAPHAASGPRDTPHHAVAEHAQESFAAGSGPPADAESGTGGGKPERLPEAASHGQETAAAHKSPQARDAPGPSGTPRGKGPSGDKQGPPASLPVPQAPGKPPAQTPPTGTPPANAGTPPNAAPPANPGTPAGSNGIGGNSGGGGGGPPVGG